MESSLSLGAEIKSLEFRASCGGRAFHKSPAALRYLPKGAFVFAGAKRRCNLFCRENSEFQSCFTESMNIKTNCLKGLQNVIM